jgi:hypothetical protein
VSHPFTKKKAEALQALPLFHFGTMPNKKVVLRLPKVLKIKLNES